MRHPRRRWTIDALPDTEVVSMIRSLLVLKARPGRREELLRTVEVLGLRTLVEDQHGFLEVGHALYARAGCLGHGRATENTREPWKRLKT